MTEMLNALTVVAVIVLIAGLIGIGYVILWTAYFFPIIKLRQHNEAKKKQDDELQKVMIKKATTQELLEEKKEEYAILSKQIMETKLELEKLQAKQIKMAEAQGKKPPKQLQKNKERPSAGSDEGVE